MTTSINLYHEFLAKITPFDFLDSTELERIVSKLEPLRYRMGQAILVKESLPANIYILHTGQARLLGYPPDSIAPQTLLKLEPGAIIGVTGIIRSCPCETVIASTESVCLTLKVSDFQELLSQQPDIAAYFRNQLSLIEAYDLIGAETNRRGKVVEDLKQIALASRKQATVLNLPCGKTPLSQIDPNLLWLVSSESSNYPVGSVINPTNNQEYIQSTGKGIRLIGFTDPTLSFFQNAIAPEADVGINPSLSESIPFAPLKPEVAPSTTNKQVKYPYIHGKGVVDATLACFQMLALLWNIPWKRDVLKRALENNYKRTGSISIEVCGAVAELMGLKAQLVEVPAVAVSKLPTPILLSWQGTFAIIYHANEKELTLAIPEIGIVRKKPAEFIEAWGESGQVLLLQSTPETPKKRFDLSWFLPAIKKYKVVLIEVFIASLFVQLLGLANPLITQVIIDKVIIQNGINTLNVLGSLLIVMAIIEGIVTWLRTNLFVDTTNRIDLSLGSEVIDHLLRLPLRYFEKRPVGEISSRINELENIRSFLTGTALTVVLDAIFSVVYIGVMIFYSWLLTIVALATVPLFGLLTFIFAAIIRSQTRTKAERNAETQSYLVEVVSGIQTVKAQNIELNSRWNWQTRYGKYISSSERNVITSNTAGSLSNFLNKISSLLLLWVGAYLVLKQEITLGQLIAFRIIAGYVTSPLLRLIQLWQNFQETALSLERLADILDTPQESELAGRNNIPMPAIKGQVKYENVTFSFAKSPQPQLNSVSIEIPNGAFIGVVGQSGAGKSTLTKLIPRLYELDAGRILIDGYDISKVELYSLRRQIGMVLQDTLLFDTTVQENIALTVPDATPEEIVEAAQIACAHDFIMNLSNGYNTRVGERGSALSGGQKQRIAIARTVLQNPPLLIMDEATSALDYATERQVCSNLQAAFRGRTVLFITHRLATIKNADIILMMSAGKVAEQGTHNELIAMKGLYYCLYQQQEASSN
ncbi:peptidase domain-containing ABC transporter [Plectonema radiosum NIES-515]|uniref:Peptidase domain-containing ABC transporter n=1 Tax=Plectonema radiosum NIES-515 TaxID=2986073 RepID=A0ABT3B2L3_9CYAN|nr:peptidase domain-containing ABC transporter [Plectonema radiosum]MCV3215609.1 peptidase domain-containing ABC transporter [Plectonema radiosum NIES-515]